MNTIDHKNLPEILFEANQIAQSAGLKILEIYETDFSVVKKDNNNPHTLDDTDSHKKKSENNAENDPIIS